MKIIFDMPSEEINILKILTKGFEKNTFRGELVGSTVPGKEKTYVKEEIKEIIKYDNFNVTNCDIDLVISRKRTLNIKIDGNVKIMTNSEDLLKKVISNITNSQANINIYVIRDMSKKHFLNKKYFPGNN